MTDLLRCPFCGSKELMVAHIHVDCLTCGARGPVKGTESKAIAAWNRRVGNCAFESHPGVEMRFDGEKWVEVKL